MAQDVEHCKISPYGTVVHVAKRLGYITEVQLLEVSLSEEKNTSEQHLDVLDAERRKCVYVVLGRLGLFGGGRNHDDGALSR